ncbi:MAG: efflux RND transporter permease subunit [Candidatus Krumholzibacteriia bacterium]
MNPIRVFVRRPVLTTMLLVAFLIMGLRSYRLLTVELFPSIDFPVVVVTTVYPGAAPEEVESQITQRIEDAVSSIADVENLESTSMEGMSQVIIEFALETDVDMDAIEVKDKVDQIRFELPDNAEDPIITKFDFAAVPVMELAVSGPRSLAELYRIADDVIKERLSRVSGVAEVAIIGQRQREIRIEVAPERLRSYGLGLLDVVQAVAAQNLNVPAGRITRGPAEITLRLQAEAVSPAEFEEFRLPLPDGRGSIPLSEVADVRDTFEELREYSTFQGQPVISLSVQKRSDANTVSVADGVTEALRELVVTVPEDVRIEVARDMSTFVRDSVNDVLSNIGIGILLTSILLFLFLHDWRQTVVAALSMPTSVIATFLLVDMAGFTLNVMSLLALGISVGVLVTNSIVVIENISRYVRKGDDPYVAAEKGTAEIAVAVIASTLTNIVVFTPIAFMSGIIGRFFLQFGVTVVFATIFSLVVSFTMVPMLSARLLRPGAGIGHGDHPLARGARAWDRFYEGLAEGYRTSLVVALHRRGRTALLVGAVFAFSLFLFGFIGGEFIPLIDQNLVAVELELPAGTSLERTREVSQRIAGVLEEQPEVESILVKIGGAQRGVEDAQIVARLVPPERRDVTILEFMNVVRPRLAAIPDARLQVMPPGEGGGNEADLILNVMGPEPATLSRLAGRVHAVVNDVPGLVEVRTTEEAGKPEIAVLPLRRQLMARGLTPAQVGRTLRAAYEGEEVGVYRELGEEYDLVVQYAESVRRDPAYLEDLPLPSPGGFTVPLADVAQLERREGASEILRKDKQRLVRVSANIAQGSLSEKREVIDAGLAELEVPAGYVVAYGGSAEHQDESFASIFEALILAIILTYIVLAIILESFVHPLTIMLTLPLGLTGAAFGLFLTGETINIFSLMAVVMLVGIVVNNAILLLDYATQLRGRGLTLREALLEAAPVRLRPIIMANLAIAVGMLPQAIGGAGAEFRTAMAVVTIGGVLVSAVFTLYLIPVMATVMDRFTVEGRHERQAAATGSGH